MHFMQIPKDFDFMIRKFLFISNQQILFVLDISRARFGLGVKCLVGFPVFEENGVSSRH